MHKNHLNFKVKSMSSDGTFEGMLSVYNVVDLGHDLVEPGAFTKTIKEHGDEIPLLWQHKPDSPIGKLKLTDGPDALRVQGSLLLSLPDAQKAYALMKAGIVKGLSIGYDTIKETMDGGVRRLKEIRLWEGSAVTFPMLPAATITSVKARRERKEDFSTEYAEVQLQEAAYQMWIALRSALTSLPWSSDLSRDEKIAASEASIDQFKQTYMDFIPAYVDWLAEEYGEMSTMGHAIPETKEGRKISAATRGQLSMAHEHTKSAFDILDALMDDEADEDDLYGQDDGATSKSKAAPEEVKKSEPVVDHSAFIGLLENLKTKLTQQ